MVAEMFFGLGLLCAIAASVTVYAEVSNVNRKLPDDQQFSYFWWYWAKYSRLDRLYYQHYPDGRLITLRRICFAIMFASMVAVAGFEGFFR